MYYVTKNYGHERGLSAVFRQPQATHSHCSLLHGYALAFELTFAAKKLDDKNWVLDFGGCKFIDTFLRDTFDHKLVVAADDPALDIMQALEGERIADVIVLDRVGCESFAEYVYNQVAPWVSDKTGNRVTLRSVKVSEHGANSATYEGEEWTNV